MAHPSTGRGPGNKGNALLEAAEAVVDLARDGGRTGLDGSYGRFHDKAQRVAALVAGLAGHKRGRAVRYYQPGVDAGQGES